jgi:hypothetical protein
MNCRQIADALGLQVVPAKAPLTPLPESIDLDQFRIKRHARLGGMIHEYSQVA